MQLRARTLSDLRAKLDESYFTVDSFAIKNVPNAYPFLEVVFSPAPQFFFKVSEAESGQVFVEESPGELVTSAEQNTYKSLELALRAVNAWTRRIREEYVHAADLRGEIDLFLEQFRAKVFAEVEGEDQSTVFSDAEIVSLRESLDRLKGLVAEQGEQLKANDYQLREFEREIERIKDDLSGMPRGVWKKVASNKLLKSVKGFLGTPEGRALISEGLKKMIGME